MALKGAGRFIGSGRVDGAAGVATADRLLGSDGQVTSVERTALGTYLITFLSGGFARGWNDMDITFTPEGDAPLSIAVDKSAGVNVCTVRFSDTGGYGPTDVDFSFSRRAW